MRNITRLKLYLLLYVCIFAGCTGESKQKASAENDAFSGEKPHFWYNLEEPDSKFFLPSELEEISGIAYLSDDMLACVQDEKGVVFIYSLAEEQIVEEHKFAKGGDYEDIEVIEGFAYVVRSDGQLWKVQLSTQESEVGHYNTPLSAKNDVEGLAYDAARNRLLLACKGHSGIDEDISGSRAVYAFDLNQNKLVEDPIFLIQTDVVKQIASGRHYREDFRPSAVAVHPLSGQIYVLASVGKVLIILDEKGTVQDVHTLSAADFKQPEGICFSPDGDLFISNEGKGGKATILRFNYAKQ